MRETEEKQNDKIEAEQVLEAGQEAAARYVSGAEHNLFRGAGEGRRNGPRRPNAGREGKTSLPPADCGVTWKTAALPR